jgi:hypothetical protein
LLERAAGATYVFDLGYYEFGFWAKLDALGCRLVTRFKANTPLNKPREMPLEPRIDRARRAHRLSARPASHEPQETRCGTWVARDGRQDRDGQTLRLLTNDLDVPLTRSRICTSAAGGSSWSSAS